MNTYHVPGSARWQARSPGGFLLILAFLISLVTQRSLQAQGVPLVITAPASIAGSYTKTATVTWAPIDETISISGPVAYVGRGCNGDTYLTSPAGKIALIDRGFCVVSEKVDRAARAGAIAVLIAMDSDSPISFSFGGGSQFVPTLVIRKTDADLIKANLGAPVIVSLGLASGSPGVQILAASDVGLTTATLNGKVNPNGVETSYYFEYGLRDFPETTYTDKTPEQNAGSIAGPIAVQAPVSGLVSGASYDFRLVVTSGSLTVRSKAGTFQTPTIPTFYFGPQDTAVMEGEHAVFTAGANGTQPIGYFLEVNGEVVEGEVASSWWGSLSITFFNVQLSHAGTVRIGATNLYSAGIPTYSDPAQLTVYPAKPPTVGAVTTLGVSTTSAFLTGEVNSHGGDVFVFLEYGETPQYGKTVGAYISEGQRTEQRTFTGKVGLSGDDGFNIWSETSFWMETDIQYIVILKPGTTYHVRAVATSVGGTTYGPDSTFTTALPTTRTVLNADSEGPGSLRETIASADYYDTIVFDPAVNGRTIYTGWSQGGTLLVHKPLTIVGPGADKLTLNGDSSSGPYTGRRVLSVAAFGPVKISGITIRDGFTQYGSAIVQGGAGILNYGDLELNDCVFENNQLPAWYWEPMGGAIRHLGSRLVINRCSFLDNYGSGGAGALHNEGVSSLSTPPLDGIIHPTVIRDSVFSGNRSDLGSGAIQSGRTLEISHCSFTGNVTEGYYYPGGAIGSFPGDWFGSALPNEGLTIRNSTFSDNVCGSYVGGAIYSGPSLRVEGSTFLRNRAWQAGAIYAGSADMENSTFSENTAEEGNDVISYSVSFKHTTFGSTGASGYSIVNYGDSTLGNSLVAGSVSGAFTSLGHNIIGIGDDSSGWSGSDLVGSLAAPIDPGLGPLGNYGGTTLTYALLAGSPAIDAGDNSLATSGTDQRGTGFARLVGTAVDIGAYEVGDPFTLLQDVLVDLNARAGITQVKAEAQKLRLIMARLTAALDPALWQDTYRPVPGTSMFALQAEALALLSGMAPEAALRIAKADRIIAVTAMDDPKKAENARNHLEQGDQLLGKGNTTGAAAQYCKAWTAALR